MIRTIVPICFIKYIKMMKARIKFKSCRIDSAYVSVSAKLEDHIVIAENSVVEPTVSIGRYTYMQSNCNINNCEMGRFCSLGNNVLIGPWQHPMNMLTTNPKVYRNIIRRHEIFNDLPSRSYIGNDVWIGSIIVLF